MTVPSALTTTFTTTVAGILGLTVTWDPTIRGILVVATGVAILMGSVYLLLATNTGSRLGFLIAITGLMGWMSIMGIVWWIYGIGLVGPTATWQVTEVVTTASADDLSAARLAEARDLSTWNELPEGDTKRGEAQASADEALAGEESRVTAFESTADYFAIDAYDKGGKDPDALTQKLHLPGPHPPHYAIVQVQAVVPTLALAEGQDCPDDGTTCYEFGTTPPAAEPNTEADVVSVVMERDLGARRLPPALIALGSLLLFGIFANVLHRRDRDVTRARTEVERASTGASSTNERSDA